MWTKYIFYTTSNYPSILSFYSSPFLFLLFSLKIQFILVTGEQEWGYALEIVFEQWHTRIILTQSVDAFYIICIKKLTSKVPLELKLPV